jgi:hypothetical protein
VDEATAASASAAPITFLITILDATLRSVDKKWLTTLFYNFKMQERREAISARKSTLLAAAVTARH